MLGDDLTNYIKCTCVNSEKSCILCLGKLHVSIDKAEYILQMRLKCHVRYTMYVTEKMPN